MKLPRPTTRRYEVLKAFVDREISLDELISGFGLFQFPWRSALASELVLLKQQGYLRGDAKGYRLTSAAEQAMREAGESRVEVVSARSYNVFTAPTLDAKTLTNPNRRVSSIEKACHTHYTASDPIPFSVDD